MAVISPCIWLFWKHTVTKCECSSKLATLASVVGLVCPQLSTSKNNSTSWWPPCLRQKRKYLILKLNFSEKYACWNILIFKWFNYFFLIRGIVIKKLNLVLVVSIQAMSLTRGLKLRVEHDGKQHGAQRTGHNSHRAVGETRRETKPFREFPL